MKFVISAAITLGLSGCVSTELQTKSDDYGIAHEMIQTDQGEFRVYEHRTSRKFLVTPTLEKSAEIGAVQGITFGGADTTAVLPMEVAVVSYMAKYPKVFAGCRIADKYEVQIPVWEYILDCDGQTSTVAVSESGTGGGMKSGAAIPQRAATIGRSDTSTGGLTCEGTYSPYANRDRDGDGIECEWGDRTPPVRSTTPTRSYRSSKTCYTGPRGGRYRYTSGGKKTYSGC